MSDQFSEAAILADEPLLAVIKEYHERSDRGEHVDRNAFASSHPDVRKGLETYFRDLNLVEEMAGPTAAMDTSVADATIINGLVASGESDQQSEIPEPAIDDSGTLAGAYAGVPVTTASTGVLPEQFGRYRILKELGRGAMGAVYLAEDEQIQRKVALKVPKFPDGMSSELLERFYREARAAGNLRHPGICPVYDVGEIDGQHFITMAYIEGRPLKSLTESGRPQDITLVASIIQKIAEAMSVAHKQGVIHRDLKPANVMLEAEDQPVVMDFGLARRSVDNEEKLTQTGMVLGSPAYMSPEQVDSDNDRVGPPADIYTLGVIFYELLTGGLPFQGGLMSILRQISMDKPRPIVELRGDVGPFIQELCLKMLAKQVEDRPASMQDIAQQLSDWLEGQHVARGEAATLALSSNSVPPAMSEKSGKSDKQPGTTTDSKTSMTSSDSVNSGRNRKLLLLAGLGGALLLAASLTFFVRLGKHDVKITLSDPSIQLSVDDEVINIVNGAETVRLSAGPHTLQLQAGSLSAMVDSFIVSKDGKTALQIVLAEDRLDVFSNGRKINQDPLIPDGGQQLARTDTTPEIMVPGGAGLIGNPDAPPPAVAPFDAAQAEAHQRAWADYLGEPIEITNSIGMKLVVIPPGKFTMGTEETAISVTLTRSFRIGIHEVTLGQWKEVMGTEPWIEFNSQNLDIAAPYISWVDSVEFCRSLTERERSAGRLSADWEYRLPTDAEWEFACRAGTETAYSFGDHWSLLDQHAWWKAKTGGQPQPVGGKLPNGWGLYDMHGNLWEWCNDVYVANVPGGINPFANSMVNSETLDRVRRGGSWNSSDKPCRSSSRAPFETTRGPRDTGFRVVMSQIAKATLPASE